MLVHALGVFAEAADETPEPSWSFGWEHRERSPDPVVGGPKRAVVAAFTVRSRQVLLLAAVAGALTGLGVALFETVVVEIIFDQLLELPLWALAFMPTDRAGDRRAVAARRSGRRLQAPPTRTSRRSTIPRSGLKLRTLPARMLAAIGTLGFGGAMGLEGPSLYLGASIGAALQSRFQRFLRSIDHRVLMVAGAAAGVAAIFKAPATGAVFALEVPYQDDFARKMLLPALVAAASGYLAFVAIHGTTPLIPAGGSPDLSAADLIGSIVLGAAGGLVARGFAALLRRAKRRHHHRAGLDPDRRVRRARWRSSLWVGDLRRARAGRRSASATRPSRGRSSRTARSGSSSRSCCCACLATAATVSGGGVGGLFIPLVVTGALLGRAAGAILPGPRRPARASSSVSPRCSAPGTASRSPRSCSWPRPPGGPGFIVPALLAAVAAELMMGRRSVTAYQHRPPDGTDPRRTAARLVTGLPRALACRAWVPRPHQRQPAAPARSDGGDRRRLLGRRSRSGSSRTSSGRSR